MHVLVARRLGVREGDDGRRQRARASGVGSRDAEPRGRAARLAGSALARGAGRLHDDRAAPRPRSSRLAAAARPRPPSRRTLPVPRRPRGRRRRPGRSAVAARRGAIWLPAPAGSICCAGPNVAPPSVDIAANARTAPPMLACQATVTRPPAATTLGVAAPARPLTSGGRRGVADGRCSVRRGQRSGAAVVAAGGAGRTQHVSVSICEPSPSRRGTRRSRARPAGRPARGCGSEPTRTWRAATRGAGPTKRAAVVGVRAGRSGAVGAPLQLAADQSSRCKRDVDPPDGAGAIDRDRGLDDCRQLGARADRHREE